MGKFENLIYNNSIQCCPEINFLCVHEKLRNLNLAPYLISIITKEIVQNYQIASAIFTIGVPIKTKYYSEKKFYHRCINIENLVSGNFIEIPNNQIPFYKKYFNTFSNKSSDIIYINGTGINDSLLNEIYQKLISYRFSKYQIHVEITKDELLKLFNNKSFHHFISKDKSQYFCMYELGHVSLLANYKDGVLFLHYTPTPTPNNNFESMIKYCWSNKIFDLITIHDEFDDSVYQINKFTKGSGNLKFYMMNQTISPIDKNKNGLVTI